MATPANSRPDSRWLHPRSRGFHFGNNERGFDHSPLSLHPEAKPQARPFVYAPLKCCGGGRNRLVGTANNLYVPGSRPRMLSVPWFMIVRTVKKPRAAGIHRYGVDHHGRDRLRRVAEHTGYAAGLRRSGRWGVRGRPRRQRSDGPGAWTRNGRGQLALRPRPRPSPNRGGWGDWLLANAGRRLRPWRSVDGLCRFRLLE